jgi:hypothetical protein
MSKGDEFLSNDFPAYEGAVARYGFLKFLMSKQSTYRSVLVALKKGAEFRQAFVMAYKAEPNVIAEAWARAAVRKK